MERIWDEVEEYIRKLHEDFEKARKSIEEFIEARRQDIETSVRRTTELLRPAVAEASKQAKVEVRETPEGKVEVEVHGKATIDDPELKERILEHLRKKIPSEAEK